MTDQDITDRPTRLPPRVKFGDADTQEIPFLWAEKGLCWLYRERRQVFADMMLHIMDTGFSTGRAARNGHRESR